MKPHGELRQGAVINTFGPGAMADLPDYSVLVSGLDFWKGPQEEVVEPRLSRKIAEILNVGGIQLRTPPAARDDDDSSAGIPVFRFPTWFVTQDAASTDGQQRSRFLIPAGSLSKGKFRHPDTNKGLSVVPVRFVRACRRGHIGDIDWYYFIHGPNDTCRKQGRLLFMDERGTSGDLSEVYLRCSCGGERSMAQIGIKKAELFGRCDGARPWLGPFMKESCEEMNDLLVRTASNTWFAQRISAISLPERNEAVRDAVSAAWDWIEEADGEEYIANERKKKKVAEALHGVTDAEVWAEIRIRRGEAENTPKTVKAAELETLMAVEKELGEDRPEGVFHARVLSVHLWNQKPWMAGIEKVVLVQRLREVSALLGFTRFEPLGTDTEGELDKDVRMAPLARELGWVPAIENKGEGIFIQFRKEAVHDWLKRPKVVQRLKDLLGGFQEWKSEHKSSVREFIPAYVFLHSFSHLLITSVALECGYPASSIRERIYAIPALGYGVMIYTGSSDAEGTLGGLIEVGRRISEAIHSALEWGRLCSNDPVCSQHEPKNLHERRFLQGAACHGCVLIAETSCEQQNELLDRALVLPTVAGIGAEFFT